MNNVNNADFWDDRYAEGSDRWDLGAPTPPFVRLRDSGVYPIGKMIVLGAGRGHDAFMFAEKGWEVVAVDFSKPAADAMRQTNKADQISIIEGDIFDLPKDLLGTFDYVLEYTCYCAIDPSRRDNYAKLVNTLLKPNGLWIALSFPIGKRPGGPPFVVQPNTVIDQMRSHNFTLQHREMPPDSAEGREGIEELLVMKKED